MRLLEGFIFLLNIICTVLLIRGDFKKVKLAKYIPYITFIVFIFHIIFEKTRWQLYPLYIMTIIYLIATILYTASIIKIGNISNRFRMKKTIVTVMIIFIIISGISAYAFPVYKMPAPKGQYEIGTQCFDIVDENREAIYSDNLEDNRKIKIQIWYPAENTEECEKVPWLYDGKIVAQALSKDMNFPDFILDHTALVMSNSFEKAPISEDLDEYPVVIISHGWTGFRNLHTDVAEELASNGYIVIGINHTYGAEITVFDDGEAEYLNREALPEREEMTSFLTYANILVTTYAGDVTLVLDSLEKFNKGEFDGTEFDSQFIAKLDLSKIGLLGHSTGGGGDVSVALEDDRVKALVGMDAWVEPIKKDEIEKGLDMPSLFMRSGQWEVGENNENLFSLLDNSEGPTELYQINDTTHLDFTMVYMYSPLTKYIKYTGELDGRISSSIQKGFIENFFNKNLKEDSSIDIDNVANQWKEVEKIK